MQNWYSLGDKAMENNLIDIVYIRRIKDHELTPFKAKARARISHDPDDWQEVALVLKLACAILTEDTDFFGVGIITWKSDAINHLLEYFKN